MLYKKWNKEVKNGRGILLDYQFPGYSGYICPAHYCIPNAYMGIRCILIEWMYKWKKNSVELSLETASLKR